MSRRFVLLSVVMLLFAVSALAERQAIYTFKEAIITDTGIVYTDKDLDNVNDIGFVCADSQCNSVTGTLRDGTVTSSGSSFSMQLNYPTDLQSSFGYGEYFYTSEHITWEQNPNFFGTDPSDPQGPFIVYLSKISKCIAPIDRFIVINDPQPNIPVTIEVTADLDATAYSAIKNAGPLNFIPQSLENEFYSVATQITLRIYDDYDNLVATKTIDTLIPFSSSKKVGFTWTPTQTGKFRAIASTFVTDQKCMSSDISTTTKEFHVISEEPKNSCYTLLQNLAMDDQNPSEGETLRLSFDKISNFADDYGSLTPIPTEVEVMIVRTSDGQIVFQESATLDANNDPFDYLPFEFAWDIPSGAQEWYIITINGIGNSDLCSYLENLDDTITLDVFAKGQANEAPVIEGIPDVSIEENTQPQPDFIDLWQFASDDKKEDKDLTFSIVSQSNQDLISCSITSNRHINCGMPAQDQIGISDITVEVSDGFFTDRDTFSIFVQSAKGNVIELNNIPDQETDSCNQFRDLYLDNYVNDNSDITWDYSGNNLFTISIDEYSHIATISYPSSFIGSETVLFTATNSEGSTAYDDITFTVTPCQTPNTPPVIEGIPNKTLLEDSGLNSNIIDLWSYTEDQETENEDLLFTITSQINSEIVSCSVDSNRFVSCETHNHMHGPAYITIRATDPEGLYDEDEFLVTVQPINHELEIEDIPNQTVDSCTQFSEIDLDDYAMHDDFAWTYSGNSLLTVSINQDTHKATITYPSSFTGTEEIRFTAISQEGFIGSDDSTFTVTYCPSANTQPHFDVIPDKTLKENSELNTNLVNLWNYAHDNETSVDHLVYTIASQSNTGLVNCIISDNKHVDCRVNDDRLGHSEIRVKATDPEGLYAETTFRINVVAEGNNVASNRNTSPSLRITQINYDDHVKQGDYMHVNIDIEGRKVKDLKTEIIIPELNIVEEFSRLSDIEIKIPEDATAGQYTLNVIVKSNKNERASDYKQFSIEPKEIKGDNVYNLGNPNTDNYKTTGSVTVKTYKQDSESPFSILAISLGILLVIILAVVIGLLTTKR